MSYGLQVKSFDAAGNEIVQIDTTIGLVNYVVTKKGTGSSITGLGTDPNRTRLIFIKPKHRNTSNYQKDYIVIEYDSTLSSVTFKSSGNKKYPLEADFSNISLDYYVLDLASKVTPVGDYGLKVLTSGNEVSFDSRTIKVNSKLQVTSLKPHNSMSGYGSGDISRITTNKNDWIQFDWSKIEYFTYSYNMAGIVSTFFSNGDYYSQYIDYTYQNFSAPQNVWTTYYNDPNSSETRINYYTNWGAVLLAQE
jgi:hypothetical protein